MAVFLVGLFAVATTAGIDPDGQIFPGPSVEASVSSDDLAAAAEAKVRIIDLLGAKASTGALTGRQYLVDVGELASPKPPVPAYGIWDRLAQCESTGRWNAATGNGYFGGVQMDMTFWRRHGGLAYAPRPDLASRAAQITVAEAGQRVQGWQAWPVCSRRLGLR